MTTASDVYSLGVLLYELLTGRRPYCLTSRTPAEIARIVCESVPVRPSTAITTVADTRQDDIPTGADPETAGLRTPTGPATEPAELHKLRRRLSGDLDNIVLKALSKDPARRYASVDLFSEDVRRHLEGLPVMARPDTLGYRASKFVRRNRVAVLAVAATLRGARRRRRRRGLAGAGRSRRAAQAERRFDDVRRLANSFLFEVHDAIRDLPGSTPARKLLVANGLEYLDKLARETGGRTDLRRELAAAYVKVGDVQGRPLTPNLGDVAGALASYRKAVAFYEAVGAGTAADLGLRRELGTAYVRLSDVLSATGDTRAALSFAQKGLALHKAAAPGATASPDARRELAASYSRVGDLLSSTGNLTESLAHRRTALSLMQAVASEDSDDPANLRQLGIAYQKLGNALGNPNAPNVGDFAGALEQFTQSAAVFGRAPPHIPRTRCSAAISQSSTATPRTCCWP